MVQVLLVYRLGWPLWIAIPLAFAIATTAVYLVTVGSCCWWLYHFEGDVARDDWYETWGIPLTFVMSGVYAVGDFFHDRWEDTCYALTELRVSRSKVCFLRKMGVPQTSENMRDPLRAGGEVLQQLARSFYDISREQVCYQQSPADVQADWDLWHDDTIQERLKNAHDAFWAKHAAMVQAYPNHVWPNYTHYLPQGYRCIWDGMIDAMAWRKSGVAQH